MIEVSAWPGLRLVEQIADGNRNEVWRGEIGLTSVAVRRSRRSVESLRWELDLIHFIEGHSFCVPSVVATSDGRRSADDVVVQRWIDGRQPRGATDWTMVAAELVRLHNLTADYHQRPGCCAVPQLVERRTSVDADLDAMPATASLLVQGIFSEFADMVTSVVHGDPGSSNLRITAEGQVGLLDWDESRVDVTWHDLSALGVVVLSDIDHAAAVRLSHAWEAANGWTVEPTYAQGRLSLLAAN